MILIADGGSTKADWIALDNQKNEAFRVRTLGLNPAVIAEEELKTRIVNMFQLMEIKNNVQEIHFYGAGCGTPKPTAILKKVLEDIFTNAKVFVDEDMLAAVYAATGKDPAIVCILGTGSNCSYFDTEKLHQKVQSLGYIAMDDCSGNYFGRQLLRGYYFNQMPKELAEELEEAHDLDPDVIKNHLYKLPNPNTYLATYAKFLIQNKKEPFCQKIINDGMQLFIDNYIRQFDNCEYIPVHFVGSIAYYLQDELAVMMEKNNLKLGNVLRRPIDGLIKFHTSA
jgi:N-acetylglucosamine kinase-like BadF-type ATPase